MTKATVSSSVFAEALQKVMPFASKDEARPALNGVHFDASPSGEVRMSAANGYMAAQVTVDASVDESFSTVIPLAHLPIFSPKGAWSLDIVLTPEQGFKDIRYPDINSLFPKTYAYEFEIEPEIDLAGKIGQLLRSRGKMSRYASNALRWHITDEGHVFDYCTTEGSRIVLEIETRTPVRDAPQLSETPLVKTVNIRFFSDVLKSAGFCRDKLITRLNIETGGILTFDQPVGKSRYLLMPMHDGGGNTPSVRYPGGCK
jgi:hypothetical protein